MSEEHPDTPARIEGQTTGTAALLEQVGRFDGPPEEFLRHLLTLQCKAAAAEGGAVLRAGTEGMQVVAVHPEPKEPSELPAWLSRCVEVAPEVMQTATGRQLSLHDATDLYGQPANRQLVIVPLGTQSVSGVAAFVLDRSTGGELSARRERLELTRAFLTLYEMRLVVERRGRDMSRLRAAMETLAAINEQRRFAGAAMALCNEVASRWQAERVGLGFLKGRYVKLKALSHTEKFSRKMKLVQDIEAAMEECLDQDVEVVHPSERDATCVSRAAQELSTRHGPTCVVSLPLRVKGEALGVLLVERAADRPFALEELESLRLACDLTTARMMELHEHDRWFGARAAAALHKALAALVGPKHAWAKLIVVLVFAALLFLIFAKGTYRAEAPFVLEATEQQVIPAPFDGYLKKVHVEPDDVVIAGTETLTPEDVAAGRHRVLAELDTADLRLELASHRAEREGYLKREAAAMRDGKTVEAQIARAEADKVYSQMQLLERRIEQAVITSPLGGTVVSGDLKRQIGAPVKTGDVLFEVAPIESLRAALSVPEDLIADVIVAKRNAASRGEPLRGELATAAHPEQRLPFVVERINPVAEVVDQRNVFKVRVRLTDVEGHDWMKIGMQGAAKVEIGKRRYAWIWSRRLVNWLRMKLWM